VPLVQNADWRFLLVVYHSAPHDWRADEIELIRELTTRIWTRLERARAEDALRESGKHLRALADSIPQLAWMAEPDGFIFWYNRRWYDYTGTTPEEMAGWGWQSVHDAEMLPSVLGRWQASIQTGEPFEMEFPLKGADGVFRWFLTRVNPLRNSEGKIIRWFGTNTDIDEQKRLNQRNQFVIRLDEAVRPLETAEEISLTLARLLGEYLDADRCAYAEVEEDEDHFIIPGDYTKADTHSIVGRYSMADFGSEVLRLMRENQPYVVHDVNADAQVTDGDLAAYRMTAIQAVICVPLHKNNRFTACMAVHQKTPRRWLPEEVELVTFVANRFWESIERARTVKRLHESLARETEARRLAENANRLKDEFLATLSHELRTPLNAILGWSQMLQTHNLSRNETEKALATIERSARAQNQLIDDILDVSRIVAGKLRLDVRAVDLSNIIAAAVEAARPAAEAKNILLQTLLDPQAGPISGDPDRLQQVVWNLLSNAVKFTPKGGRVQARLERVNSHVEIVVSDTGKGIEAEFLPYVFDRFRQSDGSMTRRHGGLGLGLAIARQIVELHGGSVSVESDGEDQGATFTVQLPLLPVRREAASDTRRVHPAAERGALLDCPPELDRLNVLLVDDEADSRELLTLVLDSCGAEVTTANSAAEAFATFADRKFDVLISDIGMPGEDGFSLIGRIRNLPNEEGGAVPAIALTAYARSEDRVQALRSGFQMHVAKPVEPIELIVAVANLAGRMRNPIQAENA
jgi:PAS domain S-box-containing protein